jgi:coenzyme F420 hydrogenase subunit delta
MVDDDGLFDYCKKPVLVMGCGNILYADDGFGPEVIKYIKENCEVPEEVYLLDAGAGGREILFNIVLSEKRPDLIIIVDAVTTIGKEPGEIFELTLEELGAEKADDFFLHLVPTSNMLMDLRDQASVEILILACQAGYIPEEHMEQGLSDRVGAVVPVMAKNVIDHAQRHLQR